MLLIEAAINRYVLEKNLPNNMKLTIWQDESKNFQSRIDLLMENDLKVNGARPINFLPLFISSVIISCFFIVIVYSNVLYLFISSANSIGTSFVGSGFLQLIG